MMICYIVKHYQLCRGNKKKDFFDLIATYPLSLTNLPSHFWPCLMSLAGYPNLYIDWWKAIAPSYLLHHCRLALALALATCILFIELWTFWLYVACEGSAFLNSISSSKWLRLLLKVSNYFACLHLIPVKFLSLDNSPITSRAPFLNCI